MCMHVYMSVYLCMMYYWAREASPTLGRSIEISRDMYFYSIFHILTIVFTDMRNVKYLPKFNGSYSVA